MLAGAARRADHHRRAGQGRLGVSEAALYRHFPSKARMFEAPDRVHRGEYLQPHHPHPRRRARPAGAGAADCHPAARVRRQESGAWRGCAGRGADRRNRAAAHADQPVL
ncbi:MAG: TetR family transcriptional regulator [Chromatiales bacterium]|nr:TetR family transcriptional regulator [Chromatiales bacterium]